MDSITQILRALTATDQVEQSVSDLEALGKQFRGWQEKNIPGAKTAHRLAEDYLNPAVDSAMMAGFPGPSFGIIVGPKAAGWASIPEKQKFIDPFGFRKAEISDEGFSIDRKALQDLAAQGRTNPHVALPNFEDVMRHDELFQRYPHLRKEKISIAPQGTRYAAAYDNDTNRMYVAESMLKDAANQPGSNQTLNQTGIHELSHAVQSFEGFPSGAAPRNFETIRSFRIDAAMDAVRKSSLPPSEKSRLIKELVEYNRFSQMARTAFSNYKMTLGEMEAMAAEARLPLDEAGRAGNPLYMRLGDKRSSAGDRIFTGDAFSAISTYPDTTEGLGSLTSKVDDDLLQAIPELAGMIKKENMEKFLRPPHEPHLKHVVAEPRPYAAGQNISPDASVEEVLDFFTRGGKYKARYPMRRPFEP